MKKKYYFICSICLLSLTTLAQDIIYFKDGKKNCVKISAISQKTITYKDTAQNSQIITVPKETILIAEYKSGEVYIFGNATPTLQIPVIIDETRLQRKERKLKEWRAKEQEFPNGILGFYIPELLFGRLTVSYERLFSDKTMGIKIPLSLTYDSFGFLAQNASSSNSNTASTNNNPPIQKTRGVAIITGLDINYYHDLKPALKYYFGPRIRYGTDQLLGGIEGLSVQLQNGILKSRGDKFTSTFGIGVGFFKLSNKYANLPGYDPKQVYPWASVTWRLGFRV